jgi:hypothetical protein
MAYTNDSTTIPLVGCTNFNQITINVPQAGWVVIMSTVYLRIDHTFGTRDGARVVVEVSPTNCAFSPDHWQEDVLADEPTDSFTRMAPSLLNAYYVGGAGAYTFYLNGQMWAGESAADEHRSSNMVAVFYPS